MRATLACARWQRGNAMACYRSYRIWCPAPLSGAARRPVLAGKRWYDSARAMCPGTSTMSARVIPLVAGTLEAAGVEPAAVLSRVGLGQPDVDPGGRVAHTLAFDLFHAAARVTGDQAFGLHVAERLR